MKRIILSLGIVVFAGAIVASGTGAFFSDTETSTGNTFTAGDIDLRIDNESYVTNNAGQLVASEGNSWGISDLTDELFFSFGDVKPGDIGEDTISIHAGSNDAYACMAIDLTATPENSLTEPEEDAADVGPANGDNGELQDYLNFTFWHDDGDNVFETDETVISTLDNVPASDFQGAWHTIADTVNGPVIAGNATKYVAKAWCFGTLIPNPDNSGLNNSPVDRGTTGFTCDGSGDGDQNDAQTDGVVMDVSFYAVQARNNSQFTCSSLPTFEGENPEEPLVGTALAAYAEPLESICTTIVTDEENLQSEIIAAAPGSTVCVDTGSYNEFVVDKNLTVVGLNSPTGGNAAVVVPSSASVTDLALVTSSEVTISGLKFDGNGVTTNGQVAGIRVSPNGSDVDNVNITYNVVEDIDAATGFSAKGIQWFTETGSGLSLTNSTFAHNDISDINSANKGAYGIQTVGDMDGVEVTNNTIGDFSGSWGAGIALDSKDLVTTTNVSVDHNHVMGGVGPTIFSVQVEANVDGGGIVVNTNNIETLLYGGSSLVGSPDVLNAENNWWGTAAPSVGTDVFLSPGTNVVDFAPSELSAFAQN